jgi:hypothetical protein
MFVRRRPSAVSPDIASRLSELSSLRDQGVLDADEFERAKAKLLA